jgi:hypothetical protein
MDTLQVSFKYPLKGSYRGVLELFYEEYISIKETRPDFRFILSCSDKRS